MKDSSKKQHYKGFDFASVQAILILSLRWLPNPIFQLSIALYEKEKLISGGVALSLLDYTASLFFQMRIGMSNDLLLPLDEVISPLGHSDFLSPLSVLPLYLKMWER